MNNILTKKQFKLIRAFLILKLKKLTPAFDTIDNMGINIALYNILYRPYKENISDEQLDVIFILYFGTPLTKLNNELVKLYEEFRDNDNILKTYMFLNSIPYESRQMYFFFSNNQCYKKDSDLIETEKLSTKENKECLKLIPINTFIQLYYKYKSKVKVEQSLRIVDGESFLYIDTDKFKEKHHFDATSFGGIFVIECAENYKFKDLCDSNILYRGSKRPIFTRFFLSYRCLCWPTQTLEMFLAEQKMLNSSYSEKESEDINKIELILN